MTQPGGAVQAGQALGELTIAAVAPGGQRDCADGGGVLSFAQEAMWRSARSYANDPAHHVCAAVHLEGTVTAAALERAVEWLCARHEVLRTVFAPDGDTACQRVMPASAVTLECVDLATFAPVDRGEEVDAWIRHEALSPFDLEHGPLMRLRLLDRDASSHVLIVAAHHLVSDRRSAQLLLCELGVLYDHALTQCGLAEAPDAVPPLALQYWDYASSQRVTVPDDRLVRDLDFWRAHLASIGPLNLPLDRARPAVPSHEVGYVAIRLPPALLQGLAALVRAEGATLFMGLLAGFQALLGRYSGQEDLVVGTPVANRPRPELEGLIGFFVNTLALRGDLSGRPSGRTLVRRAREAALGAFAHQELPFERLVEALAPERDLSRNPLFQIMFALDEQPDDSSGWSNLEVSDWPVRHGGVRHDLAVRLLATPSRAACVDEDALYDAVAGVMEYDTDLFERATVERLAAHFVALLGAMVAEPDVDVWALPLLSAAERRQVVDDWNATEAPYPREACVHELIEAQVARTPDAVAVVSAGGSLTYAELDARATRLAAHLRTLGVGPEARVAVCLERSAELVVALLAVLKAGGAYVPLDPSYPAERLRFMLADSRAGVLVTSGALRARVEGLDSVTVPLVDVTESAPGWARGPVMPPARAGLTPAHLAYVIYTSGSTGQPKGVLVSHQALVNHTWWQRATFAIGAADVVLQRTSVAFDAAMWEFWTPLASGARIVVLPEALSRDPDAIVAFMTQARVTIAQFVPALLEPMLEHPPATRLPCRYLFCGGEPLPGALVQAAHAWGAAAVVNLYGPTEATIDATAWIGTADDQLTGQIPVGRPVANVRVYVLDAYGAPAPVGVTGELHIGGVQVARGYLDRPALTAEKFVPDPFSVERGARLYRTGDLCRWLPDGTVEFLGRTDFQVKLRGFRIELGEIEAVLRTHAGVRSAIVVARETSPGDTRLIAYYVPADEQAGGVSVSPAALREHVKERLPTYMLPAAYVQLDTLPLTPNGKVDRGALQSIAAGGAHAPGEPETEIETTVAAVWAQVLRRERVTATDNFFDLGGHSLLVVRVAARLRQIFNRKLSVTALFQYPTVRSLAAHISTELQTGDGAPPPLGDQARDPRRQTAEAPDSRGHE